MSRKSTNVRIKLIGVILRAVAALSTDTAARCLERLFLRTRRHPAPERELGWLETARRTCFQSSGRTLSAWVWGRGPAILLAHGWEGRASQMGAFVAPALEQGFRVVSFDAPGHGRSPGDSSSLVEMAEAILDADRTFGPFVGVIAHSAGAAATTIALQRGLSVAGAVFVAPPADLGAFLHRVTRALGLPLTVARRTRARIEKRFGVEWASLRAQTIAPTMTTPLLVLHDEGDREVGIENARELVSSWPGSTLEVTEGLGHRRILRHPEVVEKALFFIKERHSEVQRLLFRAAPRVWEPEPLGPYPPASPYTAPDPRRSTADPDGAR